MSSISIRGGRTELTNLQYEQLRDDLRSGNRHKRRRATKLLSAENRRIDKEIDAQNKRLGISPT